MSAITRYAIYWLPDGALGAWGEAWLGWSMRQGRALAQPDIAGLPRPLPDLTRAASTYGLHATIKPPFRLATGQSETDLRASFDTFCATTPAVTAGALRLSDLDGFLALTPHGHCDALDALAGRVVSQFDHFRAPASHTELARRRAAGLSDSQEAMLLRWGYPYVMQDFRFHVTLTGRVTAQEATVLHGVLTPVLTSLLPDALQIGALVLVGEMQGVGFRTLAHHRLCG